MLEEPADAVPLAQMLFMDNPPEDDLDVGYGTRDGANGGNILHNPRCSRLGWDEKTQKIDRRLVKAGELKRSLKADHIEGACMHCYGDQWQHVNRLLTCVFPGSNRSKWQTRVDIDLLLTFEARERFNVESWAQWLCEATPDQIRARAKRELDWGNNPDEPYAVVFDVGGLNRTNWVVGVGDHVTVTLDYHGQRNMGGGVLNVHGFLPAKLTTAFEEHHAKAVVPVDKGFNLQHFELAVNLYETCRNEQGTRPDVVAQEAVQNAQLCLA